MFYIDQLQNPSFPVGLVKTESDVIGRSFETGLERWTLVVPVMSVDAYPFLAFSDLICHLDKACTPHLQEGGEGVKISEIFILVGKLYCWGVT